MDPFLGEIRMFAGNFPPAGWALCEGQLLPILDNEALFALIGTTYGGDGETTFALPDLRGRAPVHQGQGVGLTNRTLAEQGGVEEVTITVNQTPSHNHALLAGHRPASTRAAAGAYFAEPGRNMYASTGAGTTMAAASVAQTGSAQPHSNLMPFVTVSYIIALYGIFPPQN